MHTLLVHSFLLAVGIVHASVTVYDAHVQQPYGIVTTVSAPPASAASYDNVILTRPPLPNTPIPTSFAVELPTGTISGLSIPHQGSFFGFSTELTVVTRVLGPNSSFLQVPFLNLMTNIRERAGSVHVRVVGNKHDCATPVDSTLDGSAIETNRTSSNLVDTPPPIVTPDIIRMMARISSTANVRWYLGAPFYDTFRQVAEAGGSILGDYLVGLHAGNLDFCSRRRRRSSTHGSNDHKNESGQAIKTDSNVPDKGTLVGSNLAGVWNPEVACDAGFVSDSRQNLAALAVERYPTDNCHAQYGTGTPRTAQEVLPSFRTHKSGQQIVSEYLSSTAYAQKEGLPFIMSETNTASCGGFPGLSDSFAAALWAIDYGLQMAYANFTHAMFHVGDQGDYYNPFTPPVTDQPTSHQWTIGPVYYSSLYVAEALGPSNQSQVLDLQMNDGNEFTPGYAIYENGYPTRVALINFVDDDSGASDYTASISIGGTVPSQVSVKYLSASSVTQKHDIAWAGQTFGGVFSSDGRPVGIVDVQTVECDLTNNVCNVKVPAPGAALVFLADQGSTMMLPTTTTRTGVVDPAVLAATNGNKGIADALAGTSQSGGIDDAFGPVHVLPAVGVLVAIFTFFCLESLVSYAVTGNSLLSAVSDMIKNVR